MNITKVPGVTPPTPPTTYTVTGLTADEIRAVGIAVAKLHNYNNREGLPYGTFEGLSRDIGSAGF